MSTASTARPVVVGVDGSQRSDPALNTALDLAERLGGVPRLVHAVDPDAADDAAALERARERVLGDLQARLAGARLSPTGDEPTLHVAAGHPAAVLVEQARESGAGLLVLGEHRRRGLLDLGSTAAAALVHAPCPVWCQHGPSRRAERLLVALDLSPESRAALDLACAWSKPLDAPVHVLHVFEPPDFMALPGERGPAPDYTLDHAREKARAEVAEAVATCAEPSAVAATELEEGEVHAVLRERLREHDVLLLGTHGRTGLSAAVLGSVTRGMLREATVPVVVTSSEAARRGERGWLL